MQPPVRLSHDQPCPTCGQSWTPYIIYMNHGEAPATTGYLTMREAAAQLHQSYWTFSRGWHRLGLKPRKLGKRYYFAADDLRAMLNRQQSPKRKRGGRRRVVGLI